MARSQMKASSTRMLPKTVMMMHSDKQTPMKMVEGRLKGGGIGRGSAVELQAAGEEPFPTQQEAFARRHCRSRSRKSPAPSRSSSSVPLTTSVQLRGREPA